MHGETGAHTVNKVPCGIRGRQEHATLTAATRPAAFGIFRMQWWTSLQPVRLGSGSLLALLFAAVTAAATTTTTGEASADRLLVFPLHAEDRKRATTQ